MLLWEAAESSNGRGAQIRTEDPLFPKQVRYQTAPRPDYRHYRIRGRQSFSLGRVARGRSENLLNREDSRRTKRLWQPQFRPQPERGKNRCARQNHCISFIAKELRLVGAMRLAHRASAPKAAALPDCATPRCLYPTPPSRPISRAPSATQGRAESAAVTHPAKAIEGKVASPAGSAPLPAVP